MGVDITNRFRTALTLSFFSTAARWFHLLLKQQNWNFTFNWTLIWALKYSSKYNIGLTQTRCYPNSHLKLHFRIQIKVQFEAVISNCGFSKVSTKDGKSNVRLIQRLLEGRQRSYYYFTSTSPPSHTAHAILVVADVSDSLPPIHHFPFLSSLCWVVPSLCQVVNILQITDCSPGWFL